MACVCVRACKAHPNTCRLHLIFPDPLCARAHARFYHRPPLTMPKTPRWPPGPMALTHVAAAGSACGAVQAGYKCCECCAGACVRVRVRACVRASARAYVCVNEGEFCSTICRLLQSGRSVRPNMGSGRLFYSTCQRAELPWTDGSLLPVSQPPQAPLT